MASGNCSTVLVTDWFTDTVREEFFILAKTSPTAFAFPANVDSENLKSSDKGISPRKEIELKSVSQFNLPIYGWGPSFKPPYYGLPI